MRVICFLILLFLVGVIVIFAFQNRGIITLQFLDRNLSWPGSLVIAFVYLLGMASGWTMVGLVRRSVHRITMRPPH